MAISERPVPKVAASVAATVVMMTVVHACDTGETPRTSEMPAPETETPAQESAAPLQVPNDDVGRARMPEVSLRRMSLSLPAPEYPTSSINTGTTGMAVASIVIDTDGSVESVELLESPDAGEAVEAALRDALFSPIEHEGTPLKVEGVMTYHFLIGDSGAQVLSPEAFSTLGAGGERSDASAAPDGSNTEGRRMVAPEN